MFVSVLRIAMFPFVLAAILCQNDDITTSGATTISNSREVGIDYHCLQYVCQSNQLLCRGCFWVSKCWGDQICITKWCGDSPFFKEIQVVPNCQDFSSNSQDETEIPDFHRCCTIGRGERASLVQWENVTLENRFEQKSEDISKCQILEYVSTLKIRHCQVAIGPVVTTTAPNTSSSDKQFLSISGGTTLHQSYLSVVIFMSVIMIVLL